MSIKPSFQGEVQLAGWSESHNGGCKVTFWLADSADLDAFRAMTVRKGNTAGQRLACVLVEIGDDEKPVEHQPVKERVHVGPLCREAVGYCEMPEFWEWIKYRSEPVTAVRCESATDAKLWLLGLCGGIESRKELDADSVAAQLFVERVRLPFMRWQRSRKAVAA